MRDSRGYGFGIGAALAALIAVCIGLGIYIGAMAGRGPVQPIDDRRDSQSRAAERQNNEGGKGSSLALREHQISASDKARIDERYAAEERQRERDDLVAQQVTANWTRTMGVVAIGALILSTIGIWLIYTTFREARRTADAGREANAIARSGNRPIMVFSKYRIDPWSEGDGDPKYAHVLLIPIWVNLGPMPALVTGCRCYRTYVEGNPTQEQVSALRARNPAQHNSGVRLVPPNYAYEGPGVIVAGREVGTRNLERRAEFGGPRYRPAKFVLHIALVSYKAAIGESEEWETEQIAAMLPVYNDNGDFTTSGWGAGPIWGDVPMLKMT